MYKDILVLTNGANNGSAAVGYAVSLAEQFEAHLTGLFVIPPMDLGPYGFEYLPESLAASYHDEKNRRERTAHSAFETAAKQLLSQSEWRAVMGAPSDVVGLHARYSDVIVVQKPDPADAYGDQLESAIHASLLRARHPTIIIPGTWQRNSPPERVLVAWDGSAEAARAIRDAMPVLKNSTETLVYAIDPKNLGDLPGADISTYLARHGIKVTATQTITVGEPGDAVPPGYEHRAVSSRIDRLVLDSLPVGEALLNAATEASADLIVMGAYGVTRFWEAIFGGVSAHILKNTTVPVFMAH